MLYDKSVLQPLPSLRGINRRQFIAGGVGLVTALALPRSVKAGPKRGGTLRLGLGSGNTSDSLDPMKIGSLPMGMAAATLGNYLVELDSDKRPIPELAESWEVSKDAKRWVFRLRKGVTWHNGKPFTAADVIYSIRRHMDEKSATPLKSLFANFTDIRADGDHAVVIELKEANGDVHVIMGMWHALIIPDGTTNFTNFVGTGPYVLKSFDPGVRLIAERNPNYWKPDRAWVDRVEFIFISDANTRVNALMAGQVDAINQVDHRIVSRLEGKKGISIIEAVGAKFYTLAMSCSSDEFKNNHARLAVKHGIPRKDIVDKTMSGFGAVGNDVAVAPNDPFYNTELEQREFDPDKANWHLKQAGLESLSINLHTSTLIYPGAIDGAALMQESLAKCKVNMNIVSEPADGYWSKIWRNKDFVMARWTVRATPALMFDLAYSCGASYNESKWCDPKFDKILAEAKVETDVARKKDLYWELQAMHYATGGSCIFAFPSLLDAYAGHVRGVRPDSAGEMLGMRVSERVWLES